MTLCFFFFYCSICFVLLYKREEKKKAHNYSILGIPYIMTGLFDGPASAPLFFFFARSHPACLFSVFLFFFSVSFTWTRQFKCSALQPKHSLLLLLLSYIHTHTTLVTDMIVIIVFLVYDSKLGGGVFSPALGIHDDNNSKEIKEREKRTRTEERIKRALTLMQTLQLLTENEISGIVQYFCATQNQSSNGHDFQLVLLGFFPLPFLSSFFFWKPETRVSRVRRFWTVTTRRVEMATTRRNTRWIAFSSWSDVLFFFLSVARPT